MNTQMICRIMYDERKRRKSPLLESQQREATNQEQREKEYHDRVREY